MAADRFVGVVHERAIGGRSLLTALWAVVGLVALEFGGKGVLHAHLRHCGRGRGRRGLRGGGREGEHTVVGTFRNRVARERGKVFVARQKQQPLPIHLGPNHAEKDGQKDETVQRAKENDAQVHAEVEDSEDFRLGKGEHENATIGEGDARQDLRWEYKEVSWEKRTRAIRQGLTEVPIFSRLSFARERRVGEEQMA